MMNDDDRIKEINERLKEIDGQLDRLRNLKLKLLAEKEKLTDKKHFEKSEKLSKTEWQNETYSWSGNVREKLKKIFNIEKFRSMQLETINATLSKHDLIYVAPTGGGKSLTYQLPALVDKGITLVVSPLISLMEDQLHSLEKRGIPAKMLSAQSTKEETKKIHTILEDPSLSTSDQMKLLYVTPERMSKSKRFMQALQKCYHNSKLDRIAIDEIHSVSVLGHDFRPDYKFLGNMKTLFPNTPLIGVTATASRKVLIDIQKILNIRGCIIFNSPFNRPNLYYHVIDKPSENEACYDMLADLLSNRYKGQSGIIYTFSIKDTETLTSELLQRDIKVRPYHAQLEAPQRSSIYRQWMENKIQAVVATIAFGLGIDKQDVRFVIHHTMSKSMENFYQESGRCGRDGKYAESILMYRMADMFKISSMTFAEVNGLKNAYSMINYAINSKRCRRDQFAKHFTDVWNDENCGKMCDCCFHKNEIRIVKPPEIDIMEHYRSLLKILDKAKSTDTKLTALKLIDAWFQKGTKSARVDMPAPNIDRFYGEQILVYLIINDYLREDFHYTAYSTNSYIVQGPKIPKDNDIEFSPSRVYELPSLQKLKLYFDDISEIKPTSSRRESSSNNHRHFSQNKRETSETRKKYSSSFRDGSNYNKIEGSYREKSNLNNSKDYRNNFPSTSRASYDHRENFKHNSSFSSNHDKNERFDTRKFKSNSSRSSSRSSYVSSRSSSNDRSFSNRSRRDDNNFKTYHSSRKRRYSNEYYNNPRKQSRSLNAESYTKISSTVKSDDEDDVIIVEPKKQTAIHID
ncbi:ATP-dependent DNA helicase Q1-like [Chironomus tepperi]|uniref:ATP-dependent DNA helicase Q1-like n=1 Tax=Chironomus tepperi TaxID=113505 RepID=UPI00391F5C13